jgi:Uma2 family endonuclease
MTVPQVRRRFTPAEDYRLERDASYKSDYYDGGIFDMSGGTSDHHSHITTNILGALWHRLRGKSCRVYESNMRLKVEANGLRTYPDASVYCEALQYDPEDPEKTTAMNPTVVVEVLSPSTEGYDRGLKAQSYRQVKTLRASLLVAQDRPHVEIYQRQADGTWLLHEADGLRASVKIDAINVELPLAEIYDGMQFPATSSSAQKPT